MSEHLPFVPPVIPDFAKPELPQNPLVGKTVKFLRDNGEGELMELDAVVFGNENGGITLQVVNEHNEIEWHHDPVQGVGDGQWQ